MYIFYFIFYGFYFGDRLVSSKRELRNFIFYFIFLNLFLISDMKTKKKFKAKKFFLIFFKIQKQMLTDEEIY